MRHDGAPGLGVPQDADVVVDRLVVVDPGQVARRAVEPDDADLLQSIANQVAVAVRNARSYTTAQQRGEQEALINSIGQKIQDTTTVESALQVVARELGYALGAQNTRVVLKAADYKGTTLKGSK